MPQSTRASPSKISPISSAVALPTEAETRAADLEQEDSTARKEQLRDREARIRDAAYARSERRAFEPGHEDEDWFEAERNLDRGTPDDAMKTKSSAG